MTRSTNIDDRTCGDIPGRASDVAMSNGYLVDIASAVTVDEAVLKGADLPRSIHLALRLRSPVDDPRP